MQRNVVVSVINDLVSDQRVHRTCLTLHEQGFNVTLIGRQLPGSLPINDRPYSTKRMRLLFTKGGLFYAEFNIRLFLKLLFIKADVLHANDLDTLLPNFIISQLRGKTIVYDSHEYFTEVPEIQGRWVKKVWQRIERFIFPKLNYVFTVNQSIALIYNEQYGVEVKVMRNVPFANKYSASKDNTSKLQLPPNKKVILLQGAGINVDRGAEEMLTAMQWIDAVFLIVGSGDVMPVLKKMVNDLQLEQKVIITGKVPFNELVEYTQLADVGVTLDKDSNLNYKYSLPNKLFDYVQSDLPVIASSLVEVKRIIEGYQCGVILNDFEPRNMASQINDFLSDDNQLKAAKEGVAVAKTELIWENEKHVLLNTYQAFE